MAGDDCPLSWQLQECPPDPASTTLAVAAPSERAPLRHGPPSRSAPVAPGARLALRAPLAVAPAECRNLGTHDQGAPDDKEDRQKIR